MHKTSLIKRNIRHYCGMLICIFLSAQLSSQLLQLPKAKDNPLSGKELLATISDTSLSQKIREKLIFEIIKNGNVPNFLRKLTAVIIEKNIEGSKYQLVIFVTPDYLSIGTDIDFFYTPTTPMLAQKIADLTRTMLPTKVMVDAIYQNSKITLEPQPIPPSKEMTTIPVFKKHNDMVMSALERFRVQHLRSDLTAGNKKDIIISNKIYGQSSPRVVIYGWHTLDGKAIQPVYNKHTNTWVDYSHGVRLVAKMAFLNGKPKKLSKILRDPKLCVLVSDEGSIREAFYPTK